MKKVFLIFHFSICLFFISYSQVIHQQDCGNKNEAVGDDGIIGKGTSPEYPGGNDSLLMFIAKNISYPEYEKGVIGEFIGGTVYVSFNIDTLGNMSGIKVIRGVDKYLDKEALRVVSLINKKWKPAAFSGKPLDFEFTLPVRFLPQ